MRKQHVQRACSGHRSARGAPSSGQRGRGRAVPPVQHHACRRWQARTTLRQAGGIWCALRNFPWALTSCPSSNMICYRAVLKRNLAWASTRWDRFSEERHQHKCVMHNLQCKSDLPHAQEGSQQPESLCHNYGFAPPFLFARDIAQCTEDLNEQDPTRRPAGRALTFRRHSGAAASTAASSPAPTATGRPLSTPSSARRTSAGAPAPERSCRSSGHTSAAGQASLGIGYRASGGPDLHGRVRRDRQGQLRGRAPRQPAAVVLAGVRVPCRV